MEKKIQEYKTIAQQGKKSTRLRENEKSLQQLRLGRKRCLQLNGTKASNTPKDPNAPTTS